jgi:hypothetical protein
MGGLSSAAIPDRTGNAQGLPTLARRPLPISDTIPSGGSMPPRVGTEGGLVHVRSYVRTVDGKSVSVSAHTRSDPPGGERADASISRAEGRAVERSIAIASARSAACDAQFVSDQRVCRTLALPGVRRSCWASAMERYAQCGRGGYIPLLVIER